MLGWRSGGEKDFEHEGYDTESRVWWGHSKSEVPMKHPDGDVNHMIWSEVRFGEKNWSSPVSKGSVKMWRSHLGNRETGSLSPEPWTLQ